MIRRRRLIWRNRYICRDSLLENSLNYHCLVSLLFSQEMERTRQVTQSLISKGASTALCDMIAHLQSELVKKEKNLQDSKDLHTLSAQEVGMRKHARSMEAMTSSLGYFEYFLQFLFEVSRLQRLWTPGDPSQRQNEY